jgi:hypothetical protein
MTGRIAPFPPTPLGYFLIEPGQAPRTGDYISFGGYWWQVGAADADAETFTITAGGEKRTFLLGDDIPIARMCCMPDTRYVRPGGCPVHSGGAAP